MADFVHTFEGGTDTATITTGSFPPDNNFNTVTGPFTFSTIGKISGSLGGRVLTTTATAWRAYDSFTGVTQLACRVGFTFNAAVPSGTIFAGMVEGTGFSVSARVNTTAGGNMTVQNAAGTTLNTSAAALVAGTAYYLEMQVDVGTTTADGTINVQLYTVANPGTLLVNYASGATVNAGAGKTLVRGQLGNNDAVASLDLTFDDVLWRPGTLVPVGPVPIPHGQRMGLPGQTWLRRFHTPAWLPLPMPATIAGGANLAGAGSVTALSGNSLTVSPGLASVGAAAPFTPGGSVSETLIADNPAGVAAVALAPTVITAIVGTASLAGAGAVTAVVTEAPVASPAGAGSVAAVVTEAPIASLAGAGSVTAKVTQAVIATTAGAGAVSAVVTQAVTASLAGAGAVSAVATVIPATMTLAGAGAVTAVVTEAVTAAPTGAGAVAAVVTQACIASPAGAGAVNATSLAAGSGAASLAGAGSVTAVVTQAVTASLAGAGAVNATGGLLIVATASLAGAGAVTAAVTQAVTATAAGAGSVAALAALRGAGTLTGAGTLSANGQITGTANPAGAGAVSAKAAQGVTAVPAGAGALAALAAQAATAALAGAGAVGATGTQQVAFTVGTLTATDQRTGGPS